MYRPRSETRKKNLKNRRRRGRGKGINRKMRESKRKEFIFEWKYCKDRDDIKKWNQDENYFENCDNGYCQEYQSKLSSFIHNFSSV